MATTEAHFMLAFWDGGGEAATFSSATAFQSGFPATNLQNNRLFSRARYVAGSLSAITLVIDAGANVTANVFGVFGHNATPALTRRFRASTVSNFASTTIDTGASLVTAWDASLGHLMADDRPWGVPIVYVHPSTVSSRYFEWTFTDAANPDNYLEFGIARYGLGEQYRVEESGFTRDPKKIGPVGGEVLHRGIKHRYHDLTEAERAQLESLYAGLKSSRRFLALPEPLNAAAYRSDAIWGTIEGDVQFEVLSRSWPRRYTAEVTYREASW